MWRMRHSLGLALMAASLGCSSTRPTEHTDFVVAVGHETFIVRATDPETVRLGLESIRGGNSRFPIGPVRAGNGGFNAPWSWHLDPAEVRLVEAAIELCDGAPSYVEAHLGDYPVYCPWGARVLSVRP
jgi:hypothetical protein